MTDKKRRNLKLHQADQQREPAADLSQEPVRESIRENNEGAPAAETSKKTPQKISPENPPVLQGEQVTITGTLASMTHEQAFAQIQRHGGGATPHISRQTTLLIIGEEGWPLDDEGNPSIKLQQAEALIDEGYPLKIISESDWLRMLELHQDPPGVKRLYTPAMLSQLLHIPVHVIRGWERAGLIRAEKKLFRLPYFSYQEVTAARRVSELLQSGVTQQQLTKSLTILKKFVGDQSRILEQLELLSDHQRLVIRDEHGFLDPQTRQRFFNFATADASEPASVHPFPPQDQAPARQTWSELPEDENGSGRVLRFDLPRTTAQTSTDWVVEGCRKAEIADTPAAIRCYRQALRIRPDDVEAHFYLADSLYRLGKYEAALERYLAAIEHDPEYLEAWNQIGCVYAELNKWPEAIQAFDEALQIFPEFAETHLHKAETLRMMKRIPEAIPHWQLSLKYDACGPWAELAHQRLEQAGVLAEE